VYQQEKATYEMEWMATHALHIMIGLEILTSSFDIYVKNRQLNKLNEVEMPSFYEDLKRRNNYKEIISQEKFKDA
jgi:hypothetical protein